MAKQTKKALIADLYSQVDNVNSDFNEKRIDRKTRDKELMELYTVITEIREGVK